MAHSALSTCGVDSADRPAVLVLYREEDPHGDLQVQDVAVRGGPHEGGSAEVLLPTADADAEHVPGFLVLVGKDVPGRPFADQRRVALGCEDVVPHRELLQAGMRLWPLRPGTVACLHGWHR